MPESDYWETLFDVDLIIEKMKINKDVNLLVEFGSGYGTFTIPAAANISGRIIALDIEAEMIDFAKRRCAAHNVSNVDFILRDIIENGTGLFDAAADYVMLFNLLHHERPHEILAEAYRILKRGGVVGLIHWNHDPKTPRGPSLDVRPQPKQMLAWAKEAGFTIIPPRIRDLPPWHYGVLAQK